MNRKSFIGTLLGSAAAFPLLGHYYLKHLSNYSTKKNRLKLSLNTYSFNDYLRSGRITLFDLIKFCIDIGFDAIDPTGYYFPGYPEIPPDDYIYEFKRTAFLNGLSISGTGVKNDFAVSDKNKRSEDVLLIKEWIKVCVKLGAPVLRVFAGRDIPKKYEWDEIASWMADDLRECAEFAEDHGIILALQNHADFIKTGDQAIKLLEMVDSKWLGLHLDIGSFPTNDPYEEISKTVSYAVTWQIKENVKTSDGEKKTDLKKLFDIIYESKYSGYLPIETLGPGDPYKKVTKFFSDVKRFLI